jgi:hypothetical protein
VLPCFRLSLPLAFAGRVRFLRLHSRLLLPLSRQFFLGLLPALSSAVLWGLMLSFFLPFRSLPCLVSLSLQPSVSAVVALVRSRLFQLLQLLVVAVRLSTGGQVVVSAFRFVFALPSVRLLLFSSLHVVIQRLSVFLPLQSLGVRCSRVVSQLVSVFRCSSSVSVFPPLGYRVLVVVLGHSSRSQAVQLVSGLPNH